MLPNKYSALPLMVVLVIVVVLVVTFSFSGVSALACGGSWQAITPDVSPATPINDVNDDGILSWKRTTSDTGLEAWAEIWPIDTNYNPYHGDSKSASCSRRIGYHWQGAGSPEAQTFTSTWGGDVSSNICTATADKLADFGKATELGFAKITSGDFGDGDNDKWQGRSEKGAELPANPGENQEGKISTSGTITVTAGLPTAITGSLIWDWVILDRGKARSASGEEASTDVTAGASSAVYNHPGGGTNTLVDATANHTATGTFELNAGGGNLGGKGKAVAHTTTFTMTKG